MPKRIVAALSVFVIALATMGLGRVSAKSEKNLDNTKTTGVLSAISGVVPPAVLTLQVGATSYTVNVTSDTDVVRKYNGDSGLEEFAIGDTLVVSGAVSGTTITAKKIQDTSIQRKGTPLKGKILSIDATAKSFILMPYEEELDNQTVTTSATTTFFQGNRNGDFSSLAPGMAVTIIGVWRTDLDTMAADRILIKLVEINGQIATLNCAGNVFTVKLKSTDTTSWTMNVNAATVYRDKSLDLLTCASLKVGDKVNVRGLKTGVRTMTAFAVYNKKEKQKVNEFEGTVSAVDTTAKTITVTKESKTYTLTISTETILVNKNGKVITLADVLAGHKIKAFGLLSGTALTVNLLMDKSLPASS